MINLRRLTKLTLSALLGLSLLGGCVTPPKPTLMPINVVQPSEANAWELKGKLLIRSGEDKLTTNLYWLKSPNMQELRLTSMLGTTVLLLTEDATGAVLELDGKRYQNASAQTLLDGLSGFPLPLQALPLWITGQTLTNDRVEADIKGRAAHIFSHDGLWEIRISGWQEQSGTEVPKVLELIHPKARLKLQTHQWQALSDGGLPLNKSSAAGIKGV